MALHYLSTLPFVVSLLWAVIFILKWNHYSKGQRAFMPLLVPCCIYYFCYDYFYSVGSTRLLAFILYASGLSIEPLYYYGVRKFTLAEKKVPWTFWLLLLPAAIIPVLDLFDSSELPQHLMRISYIPITLYIYYRLITLPYKFEKQIRNSYADMEGKSTLPIKISILMMAFTLILNLALRYIGARNTSETILCFALLYYAIALFFIFYSVETYTFTAEKMVDEIGEEPVADEIREALEPVDLREDASDNRDALYDNLVVRLEKLMKEEQLFLQHNLKITDVSRAVGSNRTYVSNCINQVYGVSFATYINTLRIEYAQKLMDANEEYDVLTIATKSGFASHRSFQRNYQMFKDHSI